MRILLLTLFLLLCYSAFAQFNVRGYVYNKNSKKPLSGCSVFNLNTQLGTITNEKGEYIIQVNKGDKIQYSYIGMVVVHKYIIDTTRLNIAMTYQTKQIRDVIITGDNLAKNSLLYNKDYERYKDYKQIEPPVRSAKEYRQEALSGAPSVFSPISLIYYSLPKVKRKLQALIDIQILDASNKKYSLDYISLVTGETDEKKLKEIKAYCYFPPKEVVNYSYYELGLKLRDCYVDYLQNPKLPEPVKLETYESIEK